MISTVSIPPSETGFDRVLAFTIPEHNARGRVVRLGPVLDTVLSAHDYPAPIRHLLAEALVITALLGSLLKEPDSQLTLQAQATGGAVDLLVCDYRNGELRGYVSHDLQRSENVGTNPSLDTIFGEGFLAITFDLAMTDDRYQSIVPLEGNSLTQACETYFARSEQVSSLLRVGIRSEEAAGVAGGLFVQYLPEGEEGRARLDTITDHPEWEHVSVLASSIRHGELVDSGLSLESIVWRLFHQEYEVRVERMAALRKGCRCTADHFRRVLARFPEAELREMRDDDGRIPVDCAFCSKIFRIDA